MTAPADAPPTLFSPFPFQIRALQATADEVLWGGGKGSTKTQLIVVKPLYQIDKPKYKALVLRHSFPELKELLDRMHALYPKLPVHQRPQWRGDEERWEFPSGAKVQLGFCHKREHVQRYQGQEWADLLFDEIGNLADETVIDMLLAEQRCPDPSVRRQFCSTANPGGPAHGYLKRRFIGPCGKRGERVVYVKRALPDGQTLTVTRQFVPGTVLDNPIYANDPRYMARLYSLPTRLRRCLLEGDWDAATGAAFDELDEVHFVPQFNPPAHWPYIAAFDWGHTHWSVFMWGRVSEDGRVYIMDTFRWRLMPDWDLAEAILEMVPAPALRTVHAGHDLWGHAGSRGGSRDNTPTQAQYFRSKGIGVVQANIKRAAGYANMMQYLAWRETEYVERRQPMVLFADTPGNRWLHDEHLPSLVVNPDNPADVLKVDADSETGEGGDDGFDCCRMLLASRPFKARSGLPIQLTGSSDYVLRREAEKVFSPHLTEPDESRRPPALLGETPYQGA